MDKISKAEGERGMKNKVWIALAIIILAVLGYAAYQHSQQPDGSTVESREAILRNAPKKIEWHIAQEEEIAGCLLSCIYSDNKAGIAVFEPAGNGKYQLFSLDWRDIDDIVITQFVADGELYDVVWFNGAATSYAELTYTVDANKEKPMVFDTSDMPIIYTKAPAGNYALEVKYYDDAGNVYE